MARGAHSWQGGKVRMFRIVTDTGLEWGSRHILAAAKLAKKRCEREYTRCYVVDPLGRHLAGYSKTNRKTRRQRRRTKRY